MRRRGWVLFFAVGAVLVAAPLCGRSPEASIAVAEAEVRPQVAPGPRPEVVAVAVGSSARPVWLDADEVTVRKYRACVDAGACSPTHISPGAQVPCNYGSPGRDDHPMNCVDWYGAEAYCEWTGGRLCRDDEWFAACRGPADTDYPYGNAFDEDACHSAIRRDQTERLETVPVGSVGSCRGGYAGLADMVGNVSEWVDACNGDYCKFYGGAYMNNAPLEDFASCKKFCAGNQKTFKSSTIGVRCCHDADG